MSLGSKGCLVSSVPELLTRRFFTLGDTQIDPVIFCTLIRNLPKHPEIFGFPFQRTECGHSLAQQLSTVPSRAIFPQDQNLTAIKGPISRVCTALYRITKTAIVTQTTSRTDSRFLFRQPSGFSRQLSIKNPRKAALATKSHLADSYPSIHSSKNPFIRATLSQIIHTHTCVSHTALTHEINRRKFLTQKSFGIFTQNKHTFFEKINTQHNLRTISTLPAYISPDRTGRMIEKSGKGKSKTGRVL